MRPRLVRLANDLLPPALLRLVRRARRPSYGFFGSYRTYAEAAAAAGGEGYAEESLVAALVDAQVRRMDAETPVELDHRWRDLQLALGHALDGRAGQELVVLDFGGGAGSHYLDVASRRRLSGWPSGKLRWHVCETEPMAALAAPRLAGEELTFHSSLDELAGGTYDLVYVSGSLQYVPDAVSTWERLASLDHRWLALNRTPFLDAAADLYAVQRVEVPGGGTANYPGRFLARAAWLERIGRTHTVVARWDVTSERPYTQKVGGVAYEGMLLRRR